VFAKHDIVPRSLDLACYQFPLPGWMNGISAYSMWWIIIQRDWYRHQGDVEYLKKQREYLTGLIAQLDAEVDDKGEIDYTKHRVFLDWPSSPNKEGVKAGLRALLSMAFDAGAELSRVLDEKETARICESAKKRLNQTIAPHNGLKQAAALMALAGTMSAEQACNEVGSVGGAKNFSTFYGYYMLQAQAKAGQHQQALDVIRKYWGGMLDLGATSFWEDFNLDWAENVTRIDEMPIKGKKDIHGDFGDYCYPGFRHSLCHGWSAGPAAWLSEHVLGVEIEEAGCRAVRIKPNLADLDWVEGTFPTPYGVIKISHKKLPDGKIQSKVDAPKQVRVVK